jgi:hypothetical protein
VSRRLITLNGMKASEEITEEQSRQVRPLSFVEIEYTLPYLPCSSCSTLNMRTPSSSGT